jgi:hypothetical protein
LLHGQGANFEDLAAVLGTADPETEFESPNALRIAFANVPFLERLISQPGLLYFPVRVPPRRASMRSQYDGASGGYQWFASQVLPDPSPRDFAKAGAAAPAAMVRCGSDETARQSGGLGIGALFGSEGGLKRVKN